MRLLLEKFIKRRKITTATLPQLQMGELVAELLDDARSLKFVTLGGEKFKILPIELTR